MCRSEVKSKYTFDGRQSSRGIHWFKTEWRTRDITLVTDFWFLAFGSSFLMTYFILILHCILKFKFKFKFSVDLRSHIPESCATSSIWNIRIGGTGTCTPQCLRQCLYWNMFSFYISQSSINILFFWIHFIDPLK